MHRTCLLVILYFYCYQLRQGQCLTLALLYYMGLSWPRMLPFRACAFLRRLNLRPRPIYRILLVGFLWYLDHHWFAYCHHLAPYLLPYSWVGFQIANLNLAY